jgi:putative ABC transport system ATP-binding protein
MLVCTSSTNEKLKNSVAHVMNIIQEHNIFGTHLLRCQGISKTFQTDQGAIEVFKQVEFHICAGESILLFGKNGQGKSVLLSLLCGLDSPTQGDIYFDGMWFHSCSQKRLEMIRRTHIGIIFQNLNLIPSWTALENVEAALEDILPSPKAKRNRAQALLEEMGMADRVHHLPGELSMGEQQRVAIARTLIREPKMILADEPTGDLDDATAEQILQLLHRHVQKTRATLLVATHGSFRKIHFDRTFNLNHGTLFQFSNPPKKEISTVTV